MGNNNSIAGGANGSNAFTPDTGDTIYIPSDEQEAILNSLRAQFARSNAQSSASKGPAAPPIENTVDFLGKKIPVPSPDEQRQIIMDRFVKPTDNVMRVGADAITRGWADRLAATMNGTAPSVEIAKSDKAAADLPAGVRVPTQIAGALAPLMFGELPTSLMGATAMGGGVGVADTILEKGARGEAPTGDEMAVNGGMGAAGGLAGTVIGRLAGRFLRRMMMSGDPIDQYATNAMNHAYSVANTAGDAMDDSNVMIKGTAVSAFRQRLEKFLQSQGLSPEGSPDAWTAMNILRSFEGRLRTDPNAVVSLRDFNQIRRNIRDSMYTPSGIPKPSVSGLDARLIKMIAGGNGKMSEFISKLPSYPSVVQSGNIQDGVDAWNVMNAYHQRAEKLDELLGKFLAADSKQFSRGLPFDQALQQEFSKYFETKTGQAALKATFTPEERVMIKQLANGTKLTQTLNYFDRKFGYGFVRYAYNVLSHPARKLAIEHAHEMAHTMIDTVNQQPLQPNPAPIVRSVLSKLGIGAGLAAGQNTLADPNQQPGAPMPSGTE